jgi:hypothetical protein
MILKQNNPLDFTLHVLPRTSPFSTLNRSYRVERVVIIPLLRRISTIKRLTIILVQLQPLPQTLRQIRIGDKVTSEDDAIGLTGLDLDGGIVAVEVSRGEEGYAGGAEDVAEDVEGVLLLFGGGGEGG